MDRFNDCHYALLKPVKGEGKYVEWDDDIGGFGVFGDASGFCYGQYETPAKALVDYPDAY